MFICKRCGYESTTKQNLLRHLKRVITCDPSISDIPPCILIEEVSRKNYNDASCHCEFCGKQFNHRSNMYTHKKTCKSKTSDYDELKAEVEELRKMLSEKSHTTNNTTTNVITNNTTNITNNITIVLNDFGKEDTTHIESNKEFLDNCMKELLTNAIRSVIDKIYFDEDHPENRTVLMKNFKLNQLMVYDNGQWKQRHTSETIPKMLHNGKRILHKHFVMTGDEQKMLEDPDEDDAAFKFNYLTNVIVPSTNEYKAAVSKIKSAISNNKYSDK